MKPCEECPRPGRKVKCCSARLCDICAELHAHPELLTVDRVAWRKANAPEEDMTPGVVNRFKALRFVGHCWQAKKRGGVRAGKTSLHVPDIIGYFVDGTFFGAELKRDHRPGCPCDSCAGQRVWGEQLVLNRGVFIGDCRSEDQAVERLTSAWETKARAA